MVGRSEIKLTAPGERYTGRLGIDCIWRDTGMLCSLETVWNGRNLAGLRNHVSSIYIVNIEQEDSRKVATPCWTWESCVLQVYM